MSDTCDTGDEVVLREYDPPKAAKPSTTFSGSELHKIAFRHPGYRDEFNQNVILTLYAFDDSSRGLHHVTALTACGLVACNAWDGHLTRTRDGETLTLKADGLLTDKEYYFHVPDNTRYPVYPSFDHWQFPHHNLPSWWPEEIQEDGVGGDGLVAPPASGVTKAVIARDNGCVISKDKDYVEKAHLCPQSEAEWFRINGMGDYNLNDTLPDELIADDISNAIGLRPDIHKAFDDRRFVIVRKQGQWVVHLINLTQNLGHRYHNTSLKLQRGVSSLCLLVRFAWAIFPSVKKFLTRGPTHVVRMRIEEETGEGHPGYTEITREMSADEAKRTLGGSRSRSNSPEGKGKKRKGDEGAEEQDESGSSPLCTVKRQRIQSATSAPLLSDASSPTSFSPSASERCHLRIPPQSQKPHMPPETTREPAIDKIAAASVAYTYPNPYAGVVEKLAEKERLDSLRLSWLRPQRPSDPDLICCDYNAASAAYQAGMEGPAKWGGAHLCQECLGVEFLEGRDNDADLPPCGNDDQSQCLSGGRS